ncbi:glycosyltransferase [Tindallia californiensis]|uniref:sucrose-phosphate synthase n=1 Tax=Tindallia californiensis TaxID=159292 RepID=A0A1H3I888_9FIRM|nr:glycosyltransferase [Tindallia californiensis]SDY23144.1 sucrose-phosphate synthase [Tindallia californiensis]
MRIAFLNPQGNFDIKDSYWTEHPDFGGQLVYVKELANALRNKGHEVDIFTRMIIDPQWPEFEAKEEVYPDTGVRIIRIPFGGDVFLRKELLWPFLIEYVEGIIRFFYSTNDWPDFITTHYGDGGIAGVMLNEITDIPFSFTAHSLGAQKMDKVGMTESKFDELIRYYSFATRIHAERLAMKEASVRFVSTSQEKTKQYQHGLYSDLFEKDIKKFIVAPPGVNQSYFYYKKELSEKLNKIRSRDLSKHRRNLPFIISSSRLDPKKNVSGLIMAFASNAKLQERANLLIAVRGTENPYNDFSELKEEEQLEMKKILDMIQRYHLGGKVAFIQLFSQKELASCYRALASDGGVFCLTSLYEPFGLATIEAMACGLPVVVTSNGGGREILKEGLESFGVLVDPESSTQISENLLDLVKDSEKWSYFHKQGLKRVAERFTWQSTANTYEEVIANILIDKKEINEVEKQNKANDKKIDLTHYQSWLQHPKKEMENFIKSYYVDRKEGDG